MRDHARDAGREVQFGLNAFIIARDTEAEAPRYPPRNRREGQPARGGGLPRRGATGRQLAADKRGMWADSSFDDLVQYNDGFRTQLIGTPEQIAERVAAYRQRAVDLILGGFLHFQEEIEYFGSRVLPLVREIEDSEGDSLGHPVRASA